ncbi:energy transducer TonB, partial [Bacillus sp. AFS076308]|uniref:energy transducer TonB n=2 Tax=unclassified Bacillus (in: firmicutes) TaxID=185979 RepID=UPI00115E6265
YRRYPRSAERSHQEGIAYVRFTVDRQGNVLSSQVDRSSGYPGLDQETLATVRRASPVPPPPSAIQGDPIDVVVPVVFSLR